MEHQMVRLVTLFFASIVAPPLLLFSLKGKSGLRKQRNKKSEEEIQFHFNFPNQLIIDFMCTKILEGFKAEGFYVNALHYETRLYNIRKENAVISLKQTYNEIIVSSSPQQEQYIKLIILEQIVELKDFLESAGKLKNLNTIGTELLKKKKISF